jgi:hypothetical protein
LRASSRRSFWHFAVGLFSFEFVHGFPTVSIHPTILYIGPVQFYIFQFFIIQIVTYLTSWNGFLLSMYYLCTVWKITNEA